MGQTACRVLQLLQSSFPEVLLQAEEEEEELLDLSAVLQAQLPPQSEEAADVSHTQRYNCYPAATTIFPSSAFICFIFVSL